MHAFLITLLVWLAWGTVVGLFMLAAAARHPDKTLLRAGDLVVPMLIRLAFSAWVIWLLAKGY